MEKDTAENGIIAERKWANFFGFETVDGVGRKKYHPFVIRGNGTLVLTKDEIRFTRFLPRKTFIIPVAAIREVTIGHSHNLKFILFPILKIAYTENDLTRVFGVCVGRKKEALAWKEMIERTMRER